jgi:Family of unknown function (DUF6055)
MLSFQKLEITLLLSCIWSTTAQTFQANPAIGGGGSQFKDSDHFRVYGVPDNQASPALKQLEAAYSCFIGTLGWRTSGASINNFSDSGPFYKTNIYAVASLGNAAGQQHSDPRAGLPFLKVVTRSITDPKVIVHEWGHAITYAEKYWIDQKRTGCWWEPLANWVADTYMTSPLCEPDRAKFNQTEGRTIIDLNKVLGSAHQVIVDGTQGSGNYYQSWPFLTYITNNPDKFPGLGRTGLRDMIRKYKRGSNDDPLHALERVSAPTKVQEIVGRYWARMAYVDIGHKAGQRMFMSDRTRYSYSNLDSAGSGSYRVKASRAPRYMGANIIPLKASGGSVGVKVTADSGFTATLAIRGSSGTVKYINLPNGSGEANVERGEEASLVVVNTPAQLIMYDGFSISGAVAKGLNYQVHLTGASA